MASAYAAGTASTKTSKVETTVAITEWVTYGPQPAKTSRNSDSVGLKVNLGGQVSAADSGLNAVMTIHSTGRKNAIPSTHATMPQPIRPDISRTRCPAGRPPELEAEAEAAAEAEIALMTLPPRTGTPGRTCARRRWPR